MAFTTGEVVPTPNSPSPFKVVFMTGGTFLAEWPVDSEAAGQLEIQLHLTELRRIAEEEGHV